MGEIKTLVQIKVLLLLALDFLAPASLFCFSEKSA